MITIEVKTDDGKILERRTFNMPQMAAEWFERAREIYGRGITIYFGGRDVLVG
jgi:hypothetical protein